jgi:DNA-binding response OmpR family regulator
VGAVDLDQRPLVPGDAYGDHQHGPVAEPLELGDLRRIALRVADHVSGGAGAELCARLKSQADCKVVAISTLDFEATALQSGADAFLRKPLDPLELVSTIRDLLGESALLRREVEV